MLQEMQNLAKEFPETQEFVQSLSLSSFCGVMGDHTNVNRSVVQELSKEIESPLVCSWVVLPTNVIWLKNLF